MTHQQEFNIVRRMAHYHYEIRRGYSRIKLVMFVAVGSAIIGSTIPQENNSETIPIAYTIAAAALLYSGAKRVSIYNSKKQKERLNLQLQRLKSISIDNIIKED